MGNLLSCSSSGPALATAVATGDTVEACKIVQSRPDAAFYQPLRGGKSMVAVAAGRGNPVLVEALCIAAERARGKTQLRVLLNSGAARGDSALMSACSFGTSEHVDCITYLLRQGADAFLMTSGGDNCLHIAAKNAHSHCLWHLLAAWISVRHKPPCHLADAVFSDDLSQLKFVDLPNGSGMTALHLATLKGSAAAVSALLRQGASADAQITGTSVTPWLSQGSTALHIAAARGYIGCVSILLEYQSTIPGMELRRVRNFRGLKPSQLARMGGHPGLARLLSEAPTGRSSRRRHRRGAERHRHTMSPDALLAVLVQRAKLLMSLRSVSQGLDGSKPHASDSQRSLDPNSAQGEDVALALAEVLHAWRKGSGSKGSGASLMSLASAFEPMSTGHQPLEGESPHAGRGGRSSYAAAAMVQAAVNAMASCSSGSQEPFEIMPDALAPTTASQAATALQAALRMLTVQPREALGQADLLPAEAAEAAVHGASRRRSRRSTSQRHRSSSSTGRSGQADASPQRSSSRHASTSHSSPSREGSTSRGVRRRQTRNKGIASRSSHTAAQQISQLLSASLAVQAEGSSPHATPAVLSNPLYDAPPSTPTAGASSLAEAEAGRETSEAEVRARSRPAEASASVAAGAEDGRPASQLPPRHPNRSSRRLDPAGSGALSSQPSQSPPRQRPGTSGSERHSLEAGHSMASGHGPPPPYRPLMSDSLPGPSMSGPEIAEAPSTSESRASGHHLQPAAVQAMLLQTGSDMSEIMGGVDGDVMASGHISNAFLDSNGMEVDEEDEDDSEGAGEDDIEEDVQPLKERKPALEDPEWCAICMDRRLQLHVQPCDHALCLPCAYQLCARGLTAPLCPFCRGPIRSFQPIAEEV